MSCLLNAIWKESLLCILIEGILKDEHFDNNWVGHSVMKSVDVEPFKRGKGINEGGKEKKDYFDM